MLLPILGHWCFLFDGVAVGLSRSKAMRDTMLISVIGGFLSFYIIFINKQNLALWIAMLAFLALRGFALATWIVVQYFVRKREL